ncbi:hypothetical protein M0R01_04530 [bacterium]|jgi:hypothetical protein|nr:hypothetical protein [bacterium]
MENKIILLQIKNSENNEIFRIENDGTVRWLKNGKLVIAKTDKDLGRAFGIVLFEMTGVSYRVFLEQYKPKRD